MSEKLQPGYRVRTIKGGTVEVVKHLGEGGQGDVYYVNYNGQPKALKWYKPAGLGEKPQAFYDNIRNNIEKGSPSPEFLWPEDMTDWTDGTFGYIMGLRPDGYYEISHFMLRNQQFANFKVAIDAAMHIVSAFRILHNHGYSYQDLNDGNFFINPKNGKVLICDNDNVAPDKYVSGVLGKPRYMAPEIVMKKSMPNKLSDRYSMSVLLFIIFCLTHPLEGKHWLDATGLTPKAQEKLYGEEALFIMDPDDSSNGPDRVVHKNVLMVWSFLPSYMREIFLNAFSQRALLNPNARPLELDWLKALVRFRSEIVRCSCGNEIFTDEGKPCSCEKCGRKANIPFRLEFRDYCIPGIPDARIYRCQLGTCNAEDALIPIGRVFAKKDNPKLLGLRNLTQKSWQATTPSGKEKRVAADEVVPLIDGITFQIDTGAAIPTTIKIHGNK